MIETLVSAVLKNAETIPERSAVCFRDVTLTYRELAERMRMAASALRKAGVTAGTRVMITAVSKPEYVVGLLAIRYLNGTAVLVDKGAKPQTVIALEESTRPGLILSDTQKGSGKTSVLSLKKAGQGEEAAPEYEGTPEDTVLELIFTSGSTGRPKGAMLTAKAIAANTQNTVEGIGMRADDVVLLPLPLNHSFGMRVLRSALTIGATVVLQNGFVFASELENNLNSHACTALAAVPATIETVLEQLQGRANEVLGKLRYIEISAGALNRRLRRTIPELLPATELHNTWGSTESGGAVFLNVSKHPEKIAAVGKPLGGIELALIGPDGTPVEGVGPENSGRMALKGDMRMAGYWEQPELTEKTIVDGWLLTGDLVWRDEDGYVYMLGRADDIINVGGEKVSPVEVEGAAGEYAGISECACIGVADKEGTLGQIPVLYVVPEAGFAEKDLMAVLAEKLERFKLPQKIVPVDALPRNAMGKTDRRALARMWEEEGDASLMNPVIRAILGRRSIRRFTDKDIPENVLRMLLKAAVYAPSGHNLQTWHFTLIKSGEEIQRLKEAVISACEKNGVQQYGFENPRCLLLVSNDRRSEFSVQDASAAIENVMLAAYSYGLGSVWIDSVRRVSDDPGVKGILDSYGLDKNQVVWGSVALGFPEAKGVTLAKKNNVITVIE